MREAQDILEGVSKPTDSSYDEGRGISIAGSPYLAALPFAMIIVAYLGTLGFGFVYDDPAQVLHNPLLHSWRNLPGFFKHDVWSFNQVEGVPPSNYYRPVFLIWLLANYSLFGSHAWCWHLSTLCVHLLVTLLVCRLAFELTWDHTTALISAAIFGLHPTHIEAVAWISGVSESLVAAPFVGSILCHIRARSVAGRLYQSRLPARAYRLASLGLCAVAMLSKETAIVLPGVILLYEMVFPDRGHDSERSKQSWFAGAPRALKGAAPFLIIATCYLAIRFLVLEGFSRDVFPLKPATILLTWPSVIWFYIKLLVWPFGLSAFYDTPYIQTAGLGTFVVPLLFSSLACAGAYWLLMRLYAPGSRKNLIVCAGLVVLPILPLLNLSVFIEGEIAHDRYLYLPSVGFCIIVGSVLRLIRIGRVKLLGLPLAQALVVLVLLCVLAGGTAVQSVPWSSDLLLYHRGYTAAPNNKVVKNNLAIELSKRELYEEAIPMFQRALEADPDDWIALSNIGYDYFQIGRFNEAERDLNRAIQLNWASPGPHLSLGLVKQAQGRLDEAAERISEAINLRANGDGFHEALGNVLRQQGDFRGAVAQFKAEIELHPERSSAREQIKELELLLTPPRLDPGQEPGRGIGTPR